MRAIYRVIANAYFVAATLGLMLLAVLLLGMAALDVVSSVRSGDRVQNILDGIGLLIIGFAVVETSRFIAEEEIFRDKELRSSVESRRSLTKFITIIVIAGTLEALVMVFKTSRDNIADVVYPSVLFVASMFALVALGAYQWLSSRIRNDSSSGLDDRDGEE